MTLAISEILKQVELLSPDEQQELKHVLDERLRAQPATTYSNGVPKESTPVSVMLESDEAEDDDAIFDVHSLNRVPPKRTYLARAKFHFVGRGKPMPYELDSDLLEEETVSEGEAH